MLRQLAEEVKHAFGMALASCGKRRTSAQDAQMRAKAVPKAAARFVHHLYVHVSVGNVGNGMQYVGFLFALLRKSTQLDYGVKLALLVSAAARNSVRDPLLTSLPAAAASAASEAAAARERE